MFCLRVIAAEKKNVNVQQTSYFLTFIYLFALFIYLLIYLFIVDVYYSSKILTKPYKA